MCDPVSLAVVSIGGALASTGLGIAGQAQQAASQQAMYGYQAQVARNTQIVADRMAVDSEERGHTEESRARLRARSLMGGQTVTLAGQGADLSGSALDILGDTVATGETDALTIRSNAAREAWRYQTKAVDLDNEIGLAKSQQGSNGPSLTSLGASLIGGAGSVADKWYRFRL